MRAMGALAFSAALCAVPACKPPIMDPPIESTLSAALLPWDATVFEGSTALSSVEIELVSTDPPQRLRTQLLADDDLTLHGGAPFVNIEAATGARIFVTGLDVDDAPFALGRSAPFDLPGTGDLEVGLRVGLIHGAHQLDVNALARGAGSTAVAVGSRVLLVGAVDDDEQALPALVFDPLAGDIEVLAGPAVTDAAVVALPDGRAVIVGGRAGVGAAPSDAVLVYEGGTALTTVDGALEVGVFAAGAAVAPGTSFLVVVGGATDASGSTPTAAVQLLDVSGAPARVAFDSTVPWTARSEALVTPVEGLAIPTVLVSGGRGEDGALGDAGIVTWERGSWHATATGAAPISNTAARAVLDVEGGRFGHSAVATRSGQLLLLGGVDDAGAPRPPVLYAPEAAATGAFLDVDDLGGLLGRRALIAVSAQQGIVLVGDGLSVVVEDPIGRSFNGNVGVTSFTRLPDLQGFTPSDRLGGVPVPLADGTVLVVGGTNDGLPAAAEVWMLCIPNEWCP